LRARDCIGRNTRWIVIRRTGDESRPEHREKTLKEISPLLRWRPGGRPFHPKETSNHAQSDA
jgi:hypothetical protein